MRRWATRAIQLTAETAPKGRVHCRKPENRGHAAGTATGAADPLAAAGALGRRLGHRPVDEDVAGQPGPHGQAGGDEGPHLPRPLAPSVVPVEGEAQRVLDLGGGGTGEPGGARPHARVGGQPVDVVPGEAGVGHRGQAGLEGQVELACDPGGARWPTGRCR